MTLAASLLENLPFQRASSDEQVVFIDPNVANYQQLLSGVPAGTRYVVLNVTGDGLAQIVQYLQRHPGVDAIHLVSHGENGAIQIGATWLTGGNISAYRSELAQIGAAMEPGGDFLIYGCNVAENADGKALVQQIAWASHLNVAASTDVTGAAALGGNWTLGYDVGRVHTPVVFSTAAQQQFSGTLGVTVETYDGQIGFVTPGGPDGVTSFTLDGITYSTDQLSEFAVDSTTVNQFGAPPLTSGPTDGVLFGNVPGTALTSLTMSLQSGDRMAVQSFDIDINAPSVVELQAIDASGNIIGTVTLTTGTDGGDTAFHVDLTHNAAFSGVKSLKIVETDGNFLLPTLDNFTYVDLNSPPAMTASGGSTAFVEADGTTSTAVTIDGGITLIDGNATTAKQGVVSITGGLAIGQDVLGFTNTSVALYGDISATYNALTGQLTLTSTSGTATIAQWQNAFRAVTYTDTALTPNTATRTVSFTLTGDAFDSSSNTVTKTVTVSATDQTPILSTTGGTTTYRSGTAAAVIDTNVTLTDADNTTQASGTVSITAGFHSGDTLLFTNDGATMGNINASYDAGTGVLTLSSAGATATDTQWANALSAVSFSSISTVLGDRTISFATNDGTKTSVAATDTVNVTSPVLLTTDAGSASFVSGDNTASTPVTVDSGLTVSDTVAATLGSATVQVTGNFHSGEDVLSFTNDGATMGNITAAYDAATGVLTLTSTGSTATVAQWQSALDSVTYTDTAITPDTATRTISFTVVDSGGNTSDPATRTVTVTATDQTPIVTATGGTTDYLGGTAPLTIDSGITVSDLDNTTQASGTVSIVAGLQSGDTLGFTNTSSSTFGNIMASYDTLTGELTLTSAGGTASNAQWANALSAVTFASSGTSFGNRTIAIVVDDGTKTSAAATDIVNVFRTSFLVHNETELNAVFAAIGSGGAESALNADYTITFANDFALTTAVSSLTLASGDTLTIDGAGFTLDGGGVDHGFLSYAGPLTIKNLTIVNAVASVPTGADWTSGSGDVIGSGATLTNSGSVTDNGTLTVIGTLINAGALDGNGAIQLSGGVLINQAGKTLSTVELYSTGTATDTIINRGTIVNTAGNAMYLTAAAQVTNSAGAQILSGYGIRLRDSDSTVTNLGTISASAPFNAYGIYLRNGGDVVNGGAGNTTATIEGYYGIAFKSVDTIGATGTVTNDGTVKGTGASSFGVDIFNSGTVTNGRSGSATALIEGGRFGVHLGLAGQVDNFGTITSTGGSSGDYGVELENTGSVANLGSASLIEGYVGVGIQVDGTVTNAGTIASTQGTGGVALQFIAGSTRLIVDPGAVFIGYVNGAYSLGSTNTLELAAGAAAGTLTGLGTQFTNFGVVNVDAGASWVLAGSNAIGSGQTLTSAGMLTNTGSLSMVGTLIDQATLENSGTITPLAASNLIRLTAGATLINDAGGVINGGTGTPVYGVAGGAASVVNLGTIEAHLYGVYLKGGGRITNGSTSATDALIQGSQDGILLGAAGTIVNAGTVMGTVNGVVIEDGAVTNVAGGVVTGGEVGIVGYGTDTITNFGTIQPQTSAGYGVDLLNGGTVIDGGTIAGSIAVSFGGTSANLLVLEHGYHLGGSVVGSGSATNTLELLGNGAANAVTVDYNGLTLTNFGTVAFAAGASNFATLTITDTTALPGTITGFTGLHDVIDLTQLSDAGNDATYSFNASTHMLTVVGDNGAVQLHLGNGAYSGGFAVTNDGHGGTEITAGASPKVSSVTASGTGITSGNGDLKAGKTVTLTVKLDQTVTVDTTGGTPTLQLSGGGTATYAGGSGTDTLVFTYTVGAGQNTADLTVTGVNLHGGTILNGAGKAAILTGAVTNPAGTLQIDTTPPTVTPATATAAEDSAATPIGITVPGGQGSLTVKITGLPNDGTVFLADRKTKVTIGQSLTVAQLEGLTFRPTLNEHDRSSALTYTLTDAAGNSTIGTATLKIDVDNGLVYVTPGTLAGKTYDGGGDHKLIVQGSGAADLAGVSGFTEIVLTGALSVSLGNSAFTGVTPPVLVVTAQSARSTIDLTGVTGPADRVLVNVAAGAVGTDTITGAGGNDGLLISGAGRAGLTKVTGIGNIDLNGAISIALADSNFAGVPSGRIAVTAKAGHVVINDSAVKKAADGVVIFADAPDLASDTITGSASGNDVLHVLGSGTAGLAGVTGIGNMYFSASETVRFTDSNFTGVAGGKIYLTLGGGGTTVDGSAIDKAGDSLFVSVTAANLASDTLKGGAGADVLQITGPGAALNLSKVSGFDYVTVAAGSSGDKITLGNGNFAATSGLIVVTDLGSGNTINGAAIGAGSNRNLIIHGASGDTLTGGGGTNFLVAGAGLETLIGGTGDTGFALTSATGKATIQRFTATDDQLVFSDAAFNLGADEGQGGASPQQLAASVFSSATNGTFANAQNRFAYNTGTGVLYYSADGKNADKVSVAVLSGHPTLKSQDLYFFA